MNPTLVVPLIAFLKKDLLDSNSLKRLRNAIKHKGIAHINEPWLYYTNENTENTHANSQLTVSAYVANLCYSPNIKLYFAITVKAKRADFKSETST